MKSTLLLQKLLLLFLLILPSLSKADDLINLPLGSIYNISWPQVHHSEELTLDVPVTLKVKDGAKGDSLQLSLESVLLDNQLNEAACQSFMIGSRLINIRSNRATLRIRVLTALLPQPGNYNLIVNAEGLSPLPNQFNLIVSIQPAQFRPTTESLNIKQIHGLISEWSTDTTALFTLQPKYRPLKLSRISTSLDGGQSGFNGAVKFTATEEEGVLQIRPKLIGEFPISASISGRVLIRAKELSEPLSVPFLITSQLSSSWILVFLILGFISGFFIRVFLQRKIEAGKIQEDATRLMEDIAVLRIKVKDPTLRDEIKKICSDLDSTIKDLTGWTNVFSSNHIQNKQNAIANISQRYTAVLAEWRDRLTTAKANLQPLHELLDVLWQLPDPLASLIEESRRELTATDRLLEEGNAVATDTKGKALLTVLKSRVSQHIPTWKVSRLNILQSLGEVAPASQRVTWQTINSELVLNINAVPSNLITATLDLIRSALTQIHNLDASIKAQSKSLINELNNIADVVLQILKESPVVLKPELQETLYLGVIGFDRQLQSSLSNVDKAAPKAEELKEIWDSTFLNQLNQESPKREEIKSLLASGEYVKAAKELSYQTAFMNKLKEDRVTHSNQISPRVFFPFTSANIGFLKSRVAPDLTNVLSLIQRRESIKKEKEQALFLQKILLAMLLIWIGYIANVDNFIGIPKDLLAVFLWGYFSDLAVDRMPSLPAGLKR